jgi:hypothetical protein
MKLTIKPMIRAILAVLFAVVLACGLQVRTVNAADKPTQQTNPTEQPTEQKPSPTILPTEPTVTMPTLSPEYYEQLQKEAKK